MTKKELLICIILAIIITVLWPKKIGHGGLIVGNDGEVHSSGIRCLCIGIPPYLMIRLPGGSNKLPECFGWRISCEDYFD